METCNLIFWSRDKRNPSKENKVTDALSLLINNGNKETTQEYNYTKEIMSEIIDIKESPKYISRYYLKN